MSNGPAFSDEARAAALAYILAGVAGGRGVERVIREDSGKEGVPRLPSKPVFWQWHFADPRLQDELVRAREAGIEAHVDQIIEIADGTDEAPSEDPAVRRVRIYAREKAAAMLKPKKYGPKMDLTSNGETLGLAEDLAARRRRALEGRDA